ncbi:D-3-phosphoglycerate dehydrogenase [Actinomyces bovis]|uniref:D-3-phosphoglycerate dehydrogenase n=1 Tax=Actinomyces bovis TaxID=1658 RepID=A0ABY1VRJ4_9ACTO|nr:phosphoglycerate dehydrogenase [Actinomyces bovis]SPT54367.1 D-3-phosphoglycerate dehydrogenase [Actinomyces bovis]VEG56101.1 D-3-phosphoglycerate dehydrogenase [Actinomyces israelii]
MTAIPTPTERFRVKTLNAISGSGLTRFPAEIYEVGDAVEKPHALLVRSAKLHDTPIADSVLAIGRAGAGTNNIPVAAMTERGVPVFNTPGANANAVKELVLAGLFIASRNLIPAARFAHTLEGDDAAIAKAVEAGKKQFVGFELPGKTLGVIGLGAIGVQVANAALGLGLKVVGFDPAISVDHAWNLSAEVKRAGSIEEVFKRADILTVHVPLIDATRGLISTQRLALMRHSAIILNFARAEIVDEPAIISALDQGYLSGYVCDFPSNAVHKHPKCISLPHLGASTKEAERNCAIMAVDELRGFLEEGQVHNSVNFPEAVMAREPGTHRLVIVNRNVPNMVGQVSTLVAQHGQNIANLLNRSRGDLAVTLVDIDGPVHPGGLEELRAIDGVLSARVIPA